jgi:hypothetical protein
MVSTTLEEIQALQFSNLDAANEALRNLLNSYLPFRITGLQIRPLAVSLNSINGFLQTDEGKNLFFKTHVEPQSIVNEYYNSTILAEAGYPVLRPVHSVTEQGKQILIYEIVDNPSLFTVIHDFETDQRNGAERIIAAQEQADAELLDIYRATLSQISAKDHARAPVHQLFYHRLTGGRYASFYQDQEISLPGHTTNFEHLKQMHWTINGRTFASTLGELVEQAISLLDPARSDTPSVVGHGDAHNGNVFFDEQHERLFYFDPAFAGRHSPLLDLAKPLFHNVFATWMYFPNEVDRDLSITLETQDDTLVVRHDFAPTPLRVALFRSKTRQVLQPLLRNIKARGWLAAEWRAYLKLALLCCPLLTMNLADRQKFPPSIGLLGLCMAVEMGSESSGETHSLLNSELDLIEAEF